MPSTYEHELLLLVYYGEVPPPFVGEEIIAAPVISHAPAPVHGAMVKKRTQSHTLPVWYTHGNQLVPRTIIYTQHLSDNTKNDGAWTGTRL